MLRFRKYGFGAVWLSNNFYTYQSKLKTLKNIMI